MKKLCFSLSCRCLYSWGKKGVGLWVLFSMICAVIICSVQDLDLFLLEAGKCSSAKLALDSLQSPHWWPLGVCHNHRAPNDVPAHQLQWRACISVWCTDQEDLYHSHEMGRKKPVSQGLLHREAWEEEVFHCRQKLLVLFSPFLLAANEIWREEHREQGTQIDKMPSWSLVSTLASNWELQQQRVHIVCSATEYSL